MKKFSLTIFFLIGAIVLSGCSATGPMKLDEPSSQMNNSNFWPVSNLAGIKSQDIFTFTCELIEQKPTTATSNCADFGESIFDIEWHNWSSKGANGIGTYSINDCIPNCSKGTRHNSKVEVKLNNLYTNGTKYFFTNLTFEAAQKLPFSNSKSGGWNTSDYYLSLLDY